MAPADAPTGPVWTYALLTDTSDEIDRERRVQSGDGWVVLVRWVADGPEQLLHPEGSWRSTDRLFAITQNGAMEWTTEIGRREVERTVELWLGNGRLRARPELDERPPPAVLDQLESTGTATRLAATLAAGHGLGDDEIAALRRTVLAGSHDLAAGWLDVPGRVTALAHRPASLLTLLDRARKGRAFADTGAERLWALETRRSVLAGSGPPRAVWTPLTPQWLSGLSALLRTAFEGVFTTPALDCVILQNREYGVVGGPVEFVETVLDMSLDAAEREFVAYARGETVQPPCVDLAPAAERYLGRDAAAAIRTQ